MSKCDTRAVARRVLALGGHPVRVKAQSKKAVLDGWPRIIHTERDVDGVFKDGENVGILLGERGGWIVDIDIDSDAAIPIALQLLPRTFRFGRASRRSSHYLYRLTRPFAHGKLDRQFPGGHVEFRCTGHQTVFPGSIHESGELIEVEDDVPIASIEPHELLHVFDELARRCGWVPEVKPAPAVPVLRRAASPRYGEAALRAELDRLASASEGARNDTLNDVSFRIAQLRDMGKVDPSAMDDVRSIALSIGLGEIEVNATMRSAENAARTKPRPSALERFDAPEPPPPPRTADDLTRPFRGFTDELVSAMERAQGRTVAGIPIPGFPMLTDALSGLRGICLLSGPSGEGKTTLANAIALNVAQGGDGHQPCPVVYITAEMNRSDIALSMLASTCRVPSRVLLMGEQGAPAIGGEAGRLNMTEPTYSRVQLAILQTMARLEREGRLSIAAARDLMRPWDAGEHALSGISEAIQALHPGKPVLVIIDTLATLEVRPKRGASEYENDLEMDADIVNGLKRMRTELPDGSAILAVHEEGKAMTGKGDAHGIRGSSKYLYSCDQRLALIRADAEGGTRKRNKRGEERTGDHPAEVDIHVLKARAPGTSRFIIMMDHEYRHGAMREIGQMSMRELFANTKKDDDAAGEGVTFDTDKPKKKRKSKVGA